MNKHLHIIQFCLSHWYFWAGKLERHCFTTIPNTKKLIKNNLLCIFLQLSSWFLEMQQNMVCRVWHNFVITSIKPSWILSFKRNQTRFRMQSNHSGSSHIAVYILLQWKTAYLIIVYFKMAESSNIHVNVNWGSKRRFQGLFVCLSLSQVSLELFVSLICPF